MSVKQAVIPAAGFGTRFLPVTKTVPKEMMPIVDRPVIQYVVEEAVQAGIEDIFIIIQRNKKVLEEYFRSNNEIESILKQKGMSVTGNLWDAANIHFVRQLEPLGLGHAILCARGFLNNEAFAVLLGDNIFKSEQPNVKEMIELYKHTSHSVVGAQKIIGQSISQYGVVKTSVFVNNVATVKRLVEKPSVPESDLAIVGRYVLDQSIMDYLEKTQPGVGNEIQLTDAINRMTEEKKILAYCLSGRHYDIGDKASFAMANLDFSLADDDIGDLLMDHIAKHYFNGVSDAGDGSL